MKGWKLGFDLGGPSATVTDSGSFQFDSTVPEGINLIQGWAMYPYMHPIAGPGTQYVGFYAPLPSTTRFDSFDAKIKADVFTFPNTPYVPWLVIGIGKLNGGSPYVYYAGGVGAPTGTSRRDSGLKLWGTFPDGSTFDISPGPREENVKPIQLQGDYGISGSLPNTSTFHLGIQYKF